MHRISTNVIVSGGITTSLSLSLSHRGQGGLCLLRCLQQQEALRGEDTSAVIVLSEKERERDSGERREVDREREREKRCVLWLTRIARSHSLLTDEPSVEAESSAACVKLRGERNMNIMRTFPRLLSDTGQKKTPEKKDGRRMSFQRPKGTIEYSVSENINPFPRYFCACALCFVGSYLAELVPALFTLRIFPLVPVRFLWEFARGLCACPQGWFETERVFISV